MLRVTKRVRSTFFRFAERAEERLRLVGLRLRPGSIVRVSEAPGEARSPAVAGEAAEHSCE